MSFPWLTTIGVVPLVGALVIMLLPKASTELAKRLAVVFSAIPLILVIAMALQFQLQQTQHATPAAITDLQFRMLQRIVAQAVTQVPYYRARHGEGGESGARGRAGGDEGHDVVAPHLRVGRRREAVQEDTKVWTFG